MKSFEEVITIFIVETDLVVIGELIRKYRTSKGWNQEGLAHRIGVVKSYVSKIESGSQNISLALMVSLSVILEFSLDELIPGRIGEREARIRGISASFTDIEFDMFMDTGISAVTAYRKHKK